MSGGGVACHGPARKCDSIALTHHCAHMGHCTEMCDGCADARGGLPRLSHCADVMGARTLVCLLPSFICNVRARNCSLARRPGGRHTCGGCQARTAPTASPNVFRMCPGRFRHATVGRECILVANRALSWIMRPMCEPQTRSAMGRLLESIYGQVPQTKKQEPQNGDP